MDLPIHTPSLKKETPVFRLTQSLRRWWFPLLAVGLWLFSQVLPAQQPLAQTGVVEPSAACLGLPYLGDAQLHKELQLTDDQVKQLDALREQFAAQAMYGPGSKKIKGGAKGGPGAGDEEAEVAMHERLGGGAVARLEQVEPVRDGTVG